MSSKPLWHGSGCYIPKTVAVCPECGGELTARSMHWVETTGQPIASDIDIECIDYLSHLDGHQWQQHKWHPVRDKIAAWCDARVDYGM